MIAAGSVKETQSPTACKISAKHSEQSVGSKDFAINQNDFKKVFLVMSSYHLLFGLDVSLPNLQEHFSILHFSVHKSMYEKRTY